MELERIYRELETNKDLRILFEVAQSLTPEGIEALSAFASKCFDMECDGLTPEVYETVRLDRGYGYRIEIRYVTRLSDEENDSECVFPIETTGFYRAVIFADVKTQSGSELFKRILKSDFDVESVEKLYDNPQERSFEFISRPMADYRSMRWYQGLDADLSRWNEEFNKWFNKKPSMYC